VRRLFGVLDEGFKPFNRAFEASNATLKRSNVAFKPSGNAFLGGDRDQKREGAP
jgi:hypothetical protein